MGYGTDTVTEPLEGADIYEQIGEDFKLPAYVTPLRWRLDALNPDAQQRALAMWQQSGLPALWNPDGTDATIAVDQYHAWERIVGMQEEPAPDVAILLRTCWEEMDPGAATVVMRRAAAQGLDCGDQAGGIDFRNPATMTTGRCEVFERILNEVDAELAACDQRVADVLGAVADPPGQIIADPVADADELAEAIDLTKAKVDDLIAWVGTSPARAAKALAAERARKKPRAGVLNKLAPIAPTDAPGVATPPTGESTEQGGEGPDANQPAISPPADPQAHDEGGEDRPLTSSTPIPQQSEGAEPEGPPHGSEQPGDGSAPPAPAEVHADRCMADDCPCFLAGLADIEGAFAEDRAEAIAVMRRAIALLEDPVTT